MDRRRGPCPPGGSLAFAPEGASDWRWLLVGRGAPCRQSIHTGMLLAADGQWNRGLAVPLAHPLAQTHVPLTLSLTGGSVEARRYESRLLFDGRACPPGSLPPLVTGRPMWGSHLPRPPLPITYEEMEMMANGRRDPACINTRISGGILGFGKGPTLRAGGKLGGWRGRWEREGTFWARW